MNTFLILHTTYDTIECALAHNATIISAATISKFSSSKLLIPEIEALLRSTNQELAHLTAIIATTGPAPLTTLRVTLATANALQFSCTIPLVGVDGLQACIDEFKHATYPTVALFNAFNQDVYYGIYKDGNLKTGCMKISNLLQDLADSTSQSYYFIGSGSIMFKDEIVDKLGNRALFGDEISYQKLLATITKLGIKAYEQQQMQQQLLPGYVKQIA